MQLRDKKPFTRNLKLVEAQLQQLASKYVAFYRLLGHDIK